MKWLLILLVVLNLLVGGYALLSKPVAMDIHAQEVAPQLLRLIPGNWVSSRQASDSAASVPLSVRTKAEAVLHQKLDSSFPVPGKKPTASVPAAKPVKPPVKAETSRPLAAASEHVCAQWGPVAAVDEARMRKAVQELSLSAVQWSVQEEPVSTASRIWVYYPAPQDGEARKLSKSLQEKGFDNYIVQRPGAFQGAVSLGLFARQAAADDLLLRLKKAGFAQGKTQVRGEAKSRFSFRQLARSQWHALTAWQKRELPALTLKQTPCH